MLVTALIMMDSGMVALLADGIARATGQLFPFVSPFIGVLGAFLTGSNTNSNVMFGHLQVVTAERLGFNQTTLAPTQSIGGSLGSSIAPAKVIVGTTLVGLNDRQSEVIRGALPYCLILVSLVGIEALVMGAV